MRVFFFYSGCVALLLMGLLNACSTEVKLNAEPKDIWVVYGILNANDSVQYIRVSRAFLPEGNALEYAKEVDESVKGLQVSVEGAGKVYNAVELDSIPKDPQDGTFYPYTTLYRIDTKGDDALQGGERYELTVLQPGIDTFSIQSYTYVPDQVSFEKPKPVSGAGQQKCLRKVSLERDYKLEFRRGLGASFEIRAFLDYEEDFVPKQAIFGPTRQFADDFRCVDGFSVVCYNFVAKDILRSFFEQVNPQQGRIYDFAVTDDTECNNDPELLPDAFRFQVTAIDTFMTRYLSTTSPSFTDFSTVRPEYTNIEGTVESLGIFGSVSSSLASAKLDECSLFLLRLNNAPPPLSACNLD
ncbi:MAG: hypothetical protein AAFQ87_13555 [Bacteroidota bacterium]